MPQRPTERLDVVLTMFEEIKQDIKALRVAQENANLASVRHDERIKVIEDSHGRHREEHRRQAWWLFTGLVATLAASGAYIWRLVTGK